MRRSIIFPVAPARRYLMAPILGIVKDVLKTKKIINAEPKAKPNTKKETKEEKRINTKTNTNSYTVDMLLILSMLHWPFFV